MEACMKSWAVFCPCQLSTFSLSKLTDAYNRILKTPLGAHVHKAMPQESQRHWANALLSPLSPSRLIFLRDSSSAWKRFSIGLTNLLVGGLHNLCPGWPVCALPKICGAYEQPPLTAPSSVPYPVLQVWRKPWQCHTRRDDWHAQVHCKSLHSFSSIGPVNRNPDKPWWSGTGWQNHVVQSCSTWFLASVSGYQPNPWLALAAVKLQFYHPQIGHWQLFFVELHGLHETWHQEQNVTWSKQSSLIEPMYVISSRNWSNLQSLPSITR